jgi:hypothetical protein
MTPKEKAEELFGKFAMYLRANLMYDEEANEDAKQCALIAIHELIRVTPWSGDYDNEIEDFSKEFYLKVKQEIEKL